MAWLSAFAFTQLIETPLYAMALSRAGGRGRSRWLVAFGASCLSHPLIFIVLPRYWSGSYLNYVLVAEGVAVAIEASWLTAFGLPRSVWWAVAVNGASVALGLGARALFGWP